MNTLHLAGKDVLLVPAARPGAPLALLLSDGEEGRRVFDELRRRTGADFTFAAVCGFDWNGDLSPWPAPGLSKRDPPFAGRADAFLETLTGGILPGIREALPAAPAYCLLAGYSLAGLFAVWALYRTDAFARAASASGSFWYPDFLSFARSTPLAGKPARIRLSLGDREATARHPLLRTVQANTEALAAHFRELGLDVSFRLNPGNHFQDPEARMAAEICACLDEKNA